MIAEAIASFDRSLAYIRELVADLLDEDMMVQPPGIPNHAAWTLGHLIYSCQGMAAELGVEPWLADSWEHRFAYGSTPSGSNADYPSKAVLLLTLDTASDRLRHALLAASPESLAKPLSDDQVREIFPSLGQAVVQIVVAHTAFHAGQLAAWRRATGRAPVGVFI